MQPSHSCSHCHSRLRLFSQSCPYCHSSLRLLSQSWPILLSLPLKSPPFQPVLLLLPFMSLPTLPFLLSLPFKSPPSQQSPALIASKPLPPWPVLLSWAFVAKFDSAFTIDMPVVVLWIGELHSTLMIQVVFACGTRFVGRVWMFLAFQLIVVFLVFRLVDVNRHITALKLSFSA